MIQSLNTFPINHRPTGRHNIGFSGKQFVEQKILGEKILIPRAVHDAKQSVRLLVGVIESKTGEYPKTSRANGVYLGDNLFLSVEHLFYDNETKEPITFDSLFSAKRFKNSLKQSRETNEEYFYKRNKADFVDWDYVMGYKTDLSLIKTDENANIKPIKIAQSPPQTGETLYMIGTKEPLRGNKAIPLTLIKNGDNTCYTLTSDFINENHFKFERINDHNLAGLSGSPLVNNKGELVGIVCRGSIPFIRNDIEIEATKLIDIKNFLKRSRYSRELYKSLKLD